MSSFMACNMSKFFFCYTNQLLEAEIKLIHIIHSFHSIINPLNAELNPICCLLALLGAHHFLHVSRIRVNINTFVSLMGSYSTWVVSALHVPCSEFCKDGLRMLI
jgi:hypothetical protein